MVTLKKKNHNHVKMETGGVAGPVNTGLAAGGVAGPHFLANVLLP